MPQNELRISASEVLNILAINAEHRQKLVESYAKKKLKENGFNLNEHIDYHVSPITGEHIYRQPKVK